MPQKKYYAVMKGRKPGIYDNWPVAKAQVDNFAGAVYKGFGTRYEAEEWLKSPGTKINVATRKSDKPVLSQNKNQSKDLVLIYTDGGAINNPGPGGYGIVQIYNNEKKEITGGFKFTTNNRMELTAVIVALKNTEHKDKQIKIITDSSYVVNGISKGWAKSWKKNNWIKSDKKKAINSDLWAELLDLIEPLKISFQWIKGHAGHPMNERCDKLAVTSARSSGLPEDKGYKKNADY